MFDLGGVLLRYRDEWCAQQAANRFAVPYHTAWTTIQRNRPKLQNGELGLQEFWRQVSRDVGRALPADWRTLWSRELARRGGPRSSAVRWARRLRERGWRVGILSNTDASHVRVFRARRWFGGLSPELYSFELGAVKPGPEVFRRARLRLGLPGSSLLLIDDRPENVRGARRAGWHALRYTRLDALRRDLRKMGIE